MLYRYVAHLGNVKKVGVKKGLAAGFSTGFLYLSVFGMYGLAFWYGATLVIDREITIGALTTTFFGILIAAFSLGTVCQFLLSSLLCFLLAEQHCTGCCAQVRIMCEWDVATAILRPRTKTPQCLRCCCFRKGI